jgi:alkylation response protein AidB-like acyl-CoA dehydrogenase
MPSENLVVETAARVFADLADPQTIVQKRSESWKDPFWSSLQEIGLNAAWVSENLGGGGASLSEGFGIINEAGRAALGAPVAETLLAAWLLARVGISVPRGRMTVAPVRGADHLVFDQDGRVQGRARKVPFARDAEHFAVIASGRDGPVVALLSKEDCTLTFGENLAGDPSDTLEFRDTVPIAYRSARDLGERGQDALLFMGAAVRAQQIAGALDKVLEISVRYSMERVAFEKPIAKFQAVQHNLARLAGEVAAAAAASSSAVDTIAAEGIDGVAALLEIASAKIRASEAAEAGSAIAHQVHGAIGYTDEHILHRFTLRMLSWRDDFGDETYWSLKLGEYIAGRSSDDLWSLLSCR